MGKYEENGIINAILFALILFCLFMALKSGELDKVLGI